MLEYRRRKGAEGQPWHCCTNCKSWPTASFDRTTTQPESVCAQCRQLQRRQLCLPADSTYL